MSAYALPGLFPPLLFDFGIKDVYDDNNNEHEEELVVQQFILCNSTSYNGHIAAIEPYCMKAVKAKSNVKIRLSKIDAMELVKSLTIRNNDSKSSRGRLRRRSSFKSRRKNGKKMLPAIQQDLSQPFVNPIELAMQFELSITFNGRTYNACRSLAQIRQFHIELMKEIEGQDDQAIFSKKRQIANLPEVQDKGLCCTMSFGVLNALLETYVPSLQRWLDDVMILFSNSESSIMTAFLCEPLLPICVPPRAPIIRARSAPGRLECIVEEDRVDED
jgi:hypothetical protein